MPDSEEDVIVHQISNNIRDSTVQFFRGTIKLIPKAVGSGVLLRFTHRYFLVTAAHIGDDIDNIFLLIDGEALTIGGDVYNTPLPPSGKREDDKIDICICELDAGLRDLLLKKHTFLELPDLSIDHKLVDHPIYLVVGYPSTKTKPVYGGKTIIYTSLTFMTKPFPDFMYDRFGFDPMITIPFEFDGVVKSTELPDPHLAPSLEGVSGCGVWCITKITSSPKNNRKLIGIVIERVNQPGQKVIIAIKIDYVTEYLRQELKVKLPKSKQFRGYFE